MKKTKTIEEDFSRQSGEERLYSTENTSCVIVGIDLAGSPRRPTGVCLLRGKNVHTRVAFSDDDILTVIQDARPDLVPIDAPLTLPAGRMTIHERTGEHFRACDRELQRRKIRFFPITLGPMRMLTERGLALKEKIERMVCRVVECYPGAAQDVWRLPRQHHDLKGLLRGLRKKFGLRGLSTKMTSDELDAVTAALVGQFFLMGSGEMLGGEGGILIPIPLAPLKEIVTQDL
jgi:predicted nuclease with RNAse H fold